MTIGLVDILIIIFIALGAAIGFKNGAIKTGVNFVGICIVIFYATAPPYFIFFSNLL